MPGNWFGRHKITTPISAPFLPGKCGGWVHVAICWQMLIQKNIISLFLPAVNSPAYACYGMVCVVWPNYKIGHTLHQEHIASFLDFTTYTLKLELDSIPWKNWAPTLRIKFSSLIHFQELHWWLALINVQCLWEFFCSTFYRIHEKCLTGAILCTSLYFNIFFFNSETYYNHFLFSFLRFEQAFITSLISNVVKTKDTYFWIALQDQNNTGEYTWKTAGQKSEPVQYTHWNARQPRE